MKEFFNNPKFRNPLFWAALVSIIFGSAGVDFTTLTSWQLLTEAIINIFNNPVAIIAVVIGVTGVFNDNGTSGIDSLKHKR